MKINAIFAATFDPITLGHLDIITRASRLFDLSVLVALGHHKKAWLDLVQREKLVRAALDEIGLDLPVLAFDGLLIDAAKAQNARVLVRGVRDGADVSYESRLSLMNAHLMDIETVFLLSRPDLSFVSSSLVKEAHTLGADISRLVPRAVMAHLNGIGKGIDSKDY